MKKLLLILTCIFVSACDSSTWITSPYGKCENGQASFEKIDIQLERHPIEAKHYCAQSGKSYLDEYKCDGEDVMIKCGKK